MSVLLKNPKFKYYQYYQIPPKADPPLAENPNFQIPKFGFGILDLFWIL